MADHKQAVGRGRPQSPAQDIHVVALAQPLDLELVEAGQAGFERAQGFLQRLREGASDRHGFADRFHRRGQDGFGAGEFFEGEARNLRDDIIDGRLERGGRRAAGNVIGDFVERIADRQLGRDLGDGKAGRLRGQGGRARHTRVHLDHDHAAIGRIDGELHIGAAGLHADLAQHRQRGVAHDLIFLVGQGQRRGDSDGIAGVHAHRINVLDRADDDAIVRLVADNLHLKFLPAEHAFLDQHFAGRRRVDTALDDVDEFRLVIGDAAAGAAQGEGRADDRWQADVVERRQRLAQGLDVMRVRRIQADLGHRLAEKLAVLGLVDGLRRRADHLDVVFFQHAHFLERQRAIQRCLAAHGGQQGKAAGRGVTLFLDDLRDDFRSDRLDVSAVREIGIGHDRRRIGIDQNDAVAFRAQRLARLSARIIEFAGLANDNRAGANDQDRLDICPLRHIDSSFLFALTSSGRPSRQLGVAFAPSQPYGLAGSLQRSFGPLPRRSAFVAHKKRPHFRLYSRSAPSADRPLTDEKPGFRTRDARSECGVGVKRVFLPCEPPRRKRHDNRRRLLDTGGLQVQEQC